MKGLVLPDSKPPFVMKLVGVVKHDALDEISAGVETIDDGVGLGEVLDIMFDSVDEIISTDDEFGAEGMSLLADGVEFGDISTGVEMTEGSVGLGDTLRDEIDGVDEMAPIDDTSAAEEESPPTVIVELGVISAGVETTEDGVKLGNTLKDDTDGVDEVTPIDDEHGAKEKWLLPDGFELGDTWGKTELGLAGVLEDVSDLADEIMPLDDEHGAEDK